MRSSLRDFATRMAKDVRFTSGIVRRRPFQVLLQVTNRCNMKCSFCDFWPNPAPRHEELTAAEYARIAAELAQLGCCLISIEGGEPLVRHDLPDIVRAFAPAHVPTLFTNGWYVTEARARELFDAGLVHACVSIDYADAARHDRKRGVPGATERAWRALDTFLKVAPRGGKQVHVMTVLMRDNQDEWEALFAQSAERGIGHQVTLLSTGGFRRGRHGDELPDPEAAAQLPELWTHFPHVRIFRDYAAGVAQFVSGGDMPPCHAGEQTFNIDHVGNVAPCIEKINQPVGNVRTDSLAALHERLCALQAGAGCQACFTACRGFAQALGGGGSWSAFRDLSQRMRAW